MASKEKSDELQHEGSEAPDRAGMGAHLRGGREAGAAGPAAQEAAGHGRGGAWRPLPSSLGLSAWERQAASAAAPPPVMRPQAGGRPGQPAGAIPPAGQRHEQEPWRSAPPPWLSGPPAGSEQPAPYTQAGSGQPAPYPPAGSGRPAPYPPAGSGQPAPYPPAATPPHAADGQRFGQAGRSASTQYLPRAEPGPSMSPGPAYAPAHAPAYAPAHAPAYAPAYAPAHAPAHAPASPAAAAAEFADEATEVYGDDPSADSHQVKGRLAVLEGELAGHWFTLLGSEIRIGRADDNHLIVPDLAVSRHHIRLIYSQNSYRLQDLRSGNGTFVNGIHVEEATLRDGDQIEVGRTIMEFLTTDRAPGPVRFRRNLIAPGTPLAAQGLPAGAPRPQLPPVAAPPGAMHATAAHPSAAHPHPGAAHLAAPAPMPMPAAPAPPTPWAPPPASWPPQGHGLASPPAPQPARGFPRMATPPGMAAQAAAQARREMTPFSMPEKRGVPAWMVIALAFIGVTALGLVAIVLYQLFVGWGPPQPTPFERANLAYKAGRWDEALVLMKTVPADADHAADAQRAIQVLTTNRKLFADAQSLRGSDNLPEAVAKLRQIPENEPYSSEAADLVSEIEAEIMAREAARPKGPQLVPGSPLDKALELYRQERLAQSQQQLQKLGRTDAQARELATKMEELLKVLRNGRNLLQQKKAGEAMEQLERAVTLDYELGGALHTKIAPQLADLTASQIEQHLVERKHEQAGELMQKLRRLAPDHPKLAGLGAVLSSKARQLLVEATIRLREDASSRRAKANLKAVLEMVPPEDPSYVKAKAELAK